jgi:hypothetical protein
VTGNAQNPYDGQPPYGYGQQPPHPPQGQPPQGRPGQQRPQGQQPYGGQVPPPPPSPPAQGGAYPGGPLSLPDETSIYVYGEVPDGFTSVMPAAQPPRGRQQQGAYPDQPQHAPTYSRPLHWQDLLTSLLTRPLSTMERVRDHKYWLVALIVSAVGGLLALFANDTTRHEILNATLGASIPAIAITLVLVPAFCVVLGWVSHMLALQFGGDGPAQPYITLAMILTWMADLPRVVVALFVPDDNAIVVGVGLASFVLTGWLLTMLMERTHDMPWPKALGCVSVQLLALLLVLKLPLGA